MMDPNLHATEGLNQPLLEKQIIFCCLRFPPGRKKCFLIPNATQEPCAESQMKESPQVPQEKVWYHASVSKHSRFWKQSYLIYLRIITFFFFASCLFISCSQENRLSANLHAQGQGEEWSLRCFYFLSEGIRNMRQLQNSIWHYFVWVLKRSIFGQSSVTRVSIRAAS